MLVYSLAGAALLSALLVTILNGFAYAALQSLPSHTPATGLAPVLLSILTCLALLALSLLIQTNARSDAHWPTWKIGVFYCTGAYLLISTASLAGTMATHDLYNLPRQGGIFIARSIIWALSILTQGLYYGFLLVTLAHRKPCPDWPHSYSQELKSLPDSPGSVALPAQALCDPYPELKQFDTRRSSLRKYPRRSHRFSGGTLCLESSEEAKHNSLDRNSSTLSSPEPSPSTEQTTEQTQVQVQVQMQTQTQAQTQTQTHTQMSDPFVSDRDTRPLLRGSSFRSIPSLRREQNIQLSLDSLVQASSPTASSFAFDSPSVSSLTLAPPEPNGSGHNPPYPSASREHNIHPLFRSTSPCPNPNPTPGSIVKASPSAGQTITQKTLTRMRSARELRAPPPSSPSPSPGVEMEGRSRLYGRRSITPDEKGRGLNLYESLQKR
ncbi:uncharacterized protein N7482_004769 [Penicillium canariense]|uniref:Uncharacterized protein n=1 Tax=Penicillium canariense TaxID=189055 RepID=A0A9W9I9U2_9EURO|nr:uncharacterized protein N7482_004769 [Penicillium canariense]KAJ5169175.1 hypothetical protein N7482_004769 [Penicillium canariense]